MLGGCLVIPDVRAIAEAAAVVIVAAFETVELAIGRTEAGLGYERGEGGHGGVAHGGRQGAVAHGGDEAARASFQIGQLFGGVFGRLPGAGEALGVMVADDGVLFALGSGPYLHASNRSVVIIT